MFAVPGWSVSPTLLKTQTTPNPTDGEGKSKKRKRTGKDRPLAVTGENVADLWQQQFEGKPKDIKNKPNAAKDKAKKQKTNATATDIETEKVNEVAAEHETKKQQTEVPKADAASANGDVEKKSKKDKKKKDKSAPATDTTDQNATPGSKAELQPPAVPPLPPATKLTPMQSAMRQKLVSARFRHLNQTLYTAPSATSLDLFATNPEMFEDYHAGFRQQVSVWPENPVDTFINTLRQRAAIKPKFDRNRDNRKRKYDQKPANDSIQVLPRTHGTCYIADLGCGDARLASTINETKMATTHNLKIQSYDLQSPSPLVTKADIANLPLKDGEMDVAIFCLALMGTNWIDFIEEAYRVLHWKGELWVAEIKSRFGRIGGTKSRPGQPVAHSVGSKRKEKMGRKALEEAKTKATEKEEEGLLATEVDGVEPGPGGQNGETDVGGFVEVLRRRGFVLKDGDASVDLGNKMFVRMEFIKAAPAVVGKNVKEEEVVVEKEGRKFTKPKFLDERKEVSVEDEAKSLKPCLYKIR